MISRQNEYDQIIIYKFSAIKIQLKLGTTIEYLYSFVN